MTFLALSQPWSSFFLLTSGAAATLTGLMFVAVTFGSSLARQQPTATTRAFLDPVFAHFVQVFLIGCAVVVPTMTGTALGTILIAMALSRAVRMISVFGHLRRAHAASGDLELSDWLLSVVAPVLAHLLLAATGVGFLLDEPAAFNGLAAVVVSLLFIGIVGAWELLLWVATVVEPR